MSNTSHELAEEFPEKAALMSRLKQADAHFSKLADEYHEVNRAVHRAETNVEPVSAEAETGMRKKRAALKDEIWGILSQAQPES
ncbi:YdcH family protein [Cribrihabitans pelagius]|uniref:YdcH family protein n=1 Tax=Cribrihabitans pelagius TaxID=1765746 RepID=UPI003B5CED8D